MLPWAGRTTHSSTQLCNAMQSTIGLALPSILNDELTVTSSFQQCSATVLYCTVHRQSNVLLQHIELNICCIWTSFSQPNHCLHMVFSHNAYVVMRRVTNPSPGHDNNNMEQKSASVQLQNPWELVFHVLCHECLCGVPWLWDVIHCVLVSNIRQTTHSKQSHPSSSQRLNSAQLNH